MLNIRDISHLEKMAKQKQELQILEIVTSSVTHDMLTPLKSVSCLSKKLSNSVESLTQQKEAITIYNTTELLLAEVKLLLDRSMLNNNKF